MADISPIKEYSRQANQRRPDGGPTYRQLPPHRLKPDPRSPDQVKDATIVLGVPKDEFTPRVRDVPVVQRDATQATLLRGMLVIGPGHTLADVCKMLLTELQMEPKGLELRLNACASVSAMRPLAHSLRLRARGSWLVESECNLAGGRDSRRTQ